MFNLVGEIRCSWWHEICKPNIFKWWHNNKLWKQFWLMFFSIILWLIIDCNKTNIKHTNIYILKELFMLLTHIALGLFLFLYFWFRYCSLFLFVIRKVSFYLFHIVCVIMSVEGYYMWTRMNVQSNWADK